MNDDESSVEASYKEQRKSRENDTDEVMTL